MTRYDRLSESELDGLLFLAYYPGKKDKKNISSRDEFLDLFMARIEYYKCGIEFGEALVTILSEKKIISSSINASTLAHIIITTDIKLLKMAALRVYDEHKEMMK